MSALQIEFTRLLAQNQGLVHKICHLYANSEVDKQDLFQDITLQLWKAYPSFKGDSKFSTWLYRVALNTAISGLRKTSKKIKKEELKASHLNIEDEVENNEQFIQLTEAIKKLDEVDRAFIMLYLEGNSYEDISDIMGITVNHCRVKMMRIRDKLNKLIEPKNGTQRS
jgi:RNA polymerase sigma-70 factor (ECF subfamily)